MVRKVWWAWRTQLDLDEQLRFMHVIRMARRRDSMTESSEGSHSGPEAGQS